MQPEQPVFFNVQRCHMIFAVATWCQRYVRVRSSILTPLECISPSLLSSYASIGSLCPLSKLPPLSNKTDSSRKQSSLNMSSATPSAATLEAIHTLPDEVRCLYSSKNCPHHRAVKDNGDLHKLCDLHRKKANINQQRMQERRKLMRQKMIDAKKQYLESIGGASESDMANLEHLLEPSRQPCDDEFTPEDLQLLELMLFDEEDERVKAEVMASIASGENPST